MPEPKHQKKDEKSNKLKYVCILDIRLLKLTRAKDIDPNANNSNIIPKIE
jgi:hypothetical protein